MEDVDDPYRVESSRSSASSTSSSRTSHSTAAPFAANSNSESLPSTSNEAGPSFSQNRPSQQPQSSNVHDSFTAAGGQEDDDEVAEHEKDRFYAVLNVDKEASEEQIRDAYRSLAIACHPDKHSGQAAKAAAQARFHEIQKAYDVLSDRDKRNVYDYFGEEGLNSNWSISLRGRSSEELRAEFERQRAIKRVQEAEDMVNSKGEYTAQIDACALFAPPQLVPRPKTRLGTPVTFSDRWQRVGTSTLSGRHGFETGITPRMGVKLYGEMFSRNGVGSGNLFGTLRNVWGSKLVTETTVSLMHPAIAMFDATYQLDEFTFLNGQLAGSTLALPPTFRFTFGQRLSLEKPLTGFASVQSGTFSLGPWGRSLLDGSSGVMVRQESPLVTVGLTNAQLKGTGWTMSTNLGLRDFGISATRSFIAKWLGGAQLKSALNLGLMSGARVSAGGERSVTDVVKVSFGVALGIPSGVSMQFGFKRLGQSVKLPIVLSRTPRTDLAFLAMTVPLAGLFALESFYLGPNKKQKIANRLQELRRENWDFIRERRQAAKEGVRVLTSQARKKAAAERSTAGLIILDAHYGRADALPALSPNEDAEELDRLAWARVANDEEQEAELDAEEGDSDFSSLQLYCDVKIPLQALVNKSKLIIPGGRTKSNLLGFYDAAIGEKKVLRLRYLFRGRIHEHIFADKDAVAAPMRTHQIPN
ncbi:unnamed protein product [Sympodiomycopsis kandeliae]